MRSVHGLLLIFGFVDRRVEEGNSEMERKDLGMRILLGEFMSIG